MYCRTEPCIYTQTCIPCRSALNSSAFHCIPMHKYQVCIIVYYYRILLYFLQFILYYCTYCILFFCIYNEVRPINWTIQKAHTKQAAFLNKILLDTRAVATTYTFYTYKYTFEVWMRILEWDSWNYCFDILDLLSGCGIRLEPFGSC